MELKVLLNLRCPGLVSTAPSTSSPLKKEPQVYSYNLHHLFSWVVVIMSNVALFLVTSHILDH